MDGFVVTVRQRVRARVGAPLVAWSLVMAVVLVVEVVAPSATVTWAGFGVSALLGAYLGARRRVGTVLWAPVVGWMFAALPLVVACMVHFGVLKGFLIGVLLVTVGWVGIGFGEVLWIGLVALAVRSVVGRGRARSVEYFSPGEPVDDRRR